MRKIASLFTVLMLLCTFAFAQTRTVKGTIRDGKGVGIPFATISEAGTKNGTTADASGEFTIKINPSSRLIISATGFDDQTITPEGETASVILTAKAGELQEVVITTALGQNRTKRSLGYSTQSVTSDDLNKIRATDISAALAGKVSGLQVLGTPSSNFGEGNVRLRGSSSLTGGNPIYVVDGTVVNLSAINLDDVEQLTVLKGPSATAMYGVRGSGGVILITTKKGRKGAPSVTVNSLTEIGKVSLLPDYQNEYGGGYSQDWTIFNYNPAIHPAEWAAFDGQKLAEYGADESWGPRMDGTLHRSAYSWYPGDDFGKLTPFSPAPNSVKDFYNASLRLNNNVVFEGGGDNTNFRLSYNSRYTTLPFPNTRKNDHILTFKGGIKVSPKFEVTTNVNFLNVRQFGDRTEGYTNDGQNIAQNFNQWWQRQIDTRQLKDYKNPAGGYKSWNIRSPLDQRPAYWDNIYFQVYESFRRIWQNRVYGDVGVSYKILPDLKASVIFRGNMLNYGGDGRIATGGLELDRYAVNNGTTGEFNQELNLEYKKKFGDFSWDQLIGGNMRQDYRRENSANTVGGLSVPRLYSLSASVDRPIVGNSWMDYEINSLYARGTFGYKNMVFLDYSVRNDWSSALPSANRSYLYPSASASFVFSDVIGAGTIKDVLNYGKVRVAYGRVGSDLDPYSLLATYGLVPQGSLTTMSVPTTVFDPNIKPALSSEYEFGAELQFFNNRLGVDFSIYRKDGKDQIIPLTVAPTSGSSSVFINAGLIRSKGWDLILNAQPLRSRDFSWDIQVNFSRNTSKVLDLDTARNLVAYTLGTGSFGPTVQSRVGEKWGTYVGRKMRIDGKTGLPVVNSSGLYQYDNAQIMGHALPDYTAGMQTTINYKAFSLAATFAAQIGGDFFSTTKIWLRYSGLHESTVGNNDKGNPVRDDPANGGGVRVDGVLADGTPLTTYLDAQTYFSQMYPLSSENMVDATYFKMTEARLSYTVPVAKFTKVVKRAQVAAFVRNPWLIYSKGKTWGIDPSELENANAFYEGGQLPQVRSYGLNLTIGF